MYSFHKNNKWQLKNSKNYVRQRHGLMMQQLTISNTYMYAIAYDVYLRIRYAICPQISG